VFAEAARVDFVEVAQIAEGVLRGENGIPGEGALAAANGIRHLLVDEFQDTSRRQHRLLARLIGAWEERTGRTCFVVGDPMQSIYFFRDADAELFPRVARAGLDIPGEQALEFDLVRLSANFRTAHALVKTLNGFFTEVFALNDGSGVRFSMAEAARAEAAAGAEAAPEMDLHLEFMPAVRHGSAGGDAQREKDRVAAERESAREIQNAEIVDLVRAHLGRIE
jgi:ATP-dependent exoDNAse (exonuclease V) beta subunit